MRQYRRHNSRWVLLQIFHLYSIERKRLRALVAGLGLLKAKNLGSSEVWANFSAKNQLDGKQCLPFLFSKNGQAGLRLGKGYNMALTNHGLPNGGITPHYSTQYDDTLPVAQGLHNAQRLYK